METQANSTKIMISNGVIVGVGTVLASAILYVAGFIKSTGWAANLLWFILMIALIVAGFNTFKKNNNGFLTLGQALKIGMGIAVIAGVITSLYQVAFNEFIDPELVKSITDEQLQKSLEMNPDMTQEQLDASRKMVEFFSSPGVIVGAGILWNCFVGFVISLISGLIMKKTEDSF